MHVFSDDDSARYLYQEKGLTDFPAVIRKRRTRSVTITLQGTALFVHSRKQLACFLLWNLLRARPTRIRKELGCRVKNIIDTAQHLPSHLVRSLCIDTTERMHILRHAHRKKKNVVTTASLLTVLVLPYPQPSFDVTRAAENVFFHIKPT